MHTIGKYYSAQRSLEGTLIISFEVEDSGVIEKLETHKDKELTIDTKLYRQKRSLNANSYFWKLCDEIGKKLGVSKDIIYLMQLEKYGVFQDIEVVAHAAPTLKKVYRYATELYRYDTVNPNDPEERVIEIVVMRCYIGSHEYDVKQMSALINGTVNDAVDLGIETWSDEELAYLYQLWKEQYEGHI